MKRLIALLVLMCTLGATAMAQADGYSSIIRYYINEENNLCRVVLFEGKHIYVQSSHLSKLVSDITSNKQYINQAFEQYKKGKRVLNVQELEYNPKEGEYSGYDVTGFDVEIKFNDNFTIMIESVYDMDAYLYDDEWYYEENSYKKVDLPYLIGRQAAINANKRQR